MLRVEVRVKGQIDTEWSEWFEGFRITHTDQGETILIGTLADQSAQYGLIAKLRDLGLSLVSMESTEVEAP
jgi:hypothetical protein